MKKPSSALLRTAERFIRNASTSSSTPSTPSSTLIGKEKTLPLAAPSVAIWGSNTGVGKTLFSAGLAEAHQNQSTTTTTPSPLFYLKPIQTGFPVDSDSRLVAAVLGIHEEYGPHAAELLLHPKPTPKTASSLPYPIAKTLFAWKDPVSPHVAVETEGRAVLDATLVAAITAQLNAHSDAFTLVETAGGVGSPGPSGSLQCDLLRPLRLPSVLVGDGRLGGISATLSAYEFLTIRGYEVPFVVLMDGEGNNLKAIQRHVGKNCVVLPFEECLPPPVSPVSNESSSTEVVDAHLREWLDSSKDQFNTLLAAVQDHHAQRLSNLKSAGNDAKQLFWWPFTQHGTLQDTPITVVDSRAGEQYAVFNENDNSLQLKYDAAASWWTQGVSQEALPSMAHAVGAAAARYGHIIFPQTVHEPALTLARRALEIVGGDWATRAFFTDNGSTAVEVALKMAFRKYAVDNGLWYLQKTGEAEENSSNSSSSDSISVDDDASSSVEFIVLGLEEAYHGDTLGAMDAVPPSVFNGPLQTPWFTGRSLSLDPPTVEMKRGRWQLRAPPSGWLTENLTEQQLRFSSLEQVFGERGEARGAAAAAGSSSSSTLHECYRDYINARIDACIGGGPVSSRRKHVAACIIEPVLQGAGGMRLIDPVFQRTMAEVCKRRGIPLILDEVFTGFWRLGSSSAAAMLGIQPDIACYAKLLTGGVVPMALTLAREEIFEAFSGDSKPYALLHGHSYTAHPIGCAAAVQALEIFTNPALNPNICTPRVAHRCCLEKQTGTPCSAPCGKLLPLWNDADVAALSHRDEVEGVVALGTVLAVKLKQQQQQQQQQQRGAIHVSGYAANTAGHVTKLLAKQGVIARPLGNVVYIMVTPMSAPEQCAVLVEALKAALDEFSQS